VITSLLQSGLVSKTYHQHLVSAVAWGWDRGGVQQLQGCVSTPAM